MSPALVAALTLGGVFLALLAESRLSLRNERRLREGGAIEPPDDVYVTMRWVYPAAFVAMAAEGALFGPQPGWTTAAGLALFGAAKALKWWAVASLGPRWTFRVLVVPGAPLVAHGPYAWMRHPNYIGVVGELLGVALLVGARVSGPLATLGFSLLLGRRIDVEERALERLSGR